MPYNKTWRVNMWQIPALAMVVTTAAVLSVSASFATEPARPNGGTSDVRGELRAAEHWYAAGQFERALAEYSRLAADKPTDKAVRLRVLQCKMALGSSTPSEDAELRALRVSRAREASQQLTEAREALLRAKGLARDGRQEEASKIVNRVDRELNALAGEVDVSELRRRVDEAIRVVQTAGRVPAAATPRSEAHPQAAIGEAAPVARVAPGAGRHRLVKQGDRYVIVAAVDPVVAARADGLSGVGADVAVTAGAVPVAGGAPGAVILPPPPRPATVVPLVPPVDRVPGPVAAADPRYSKPGAPTKADVLWLYSEYVDLPSAVQADILRAQQYIRQAPKYHYERMLALTADIAFGQNMMQLKSEAIMPVVHPRHDYVVSLPRGVDYRAPSPDDSGLVLGEHPDGSVSVAYDLSFLALTDGPFDGLSFSRYLFNGYEGLFIQSLTTPGVPFYSPTYVVNGGFGGAGGGGPAGLGGFGGFGVFPQSRSQIFGGTPADFAAGYPYVANSFFNVPFGYRDPVEIARLINTINTLVNDPSLTPRTPRPMPAPMPAPAP